MWKIAAGLTCMLALAACSTTKVGLKYDNPQSPNKVTASTTPAPVMVGSFVDQRGEPANWLGAIRGGYGNPLKNIESDQPVSLLVQTAFADGLRARGVQDSSSAPLQLAGVIRQLDCNQMARREANVEIEISVIDAATGQSSFSRSYSSANVEGSLLSFKVGVFASVEDLRALTERTLRETVDKALDDSALRTALRL
jgi:uncharacterized lipoprotein YajG